MINLEDVRVTGLTFEGSFNSDFGGKTPTVLVLGLTKGEKMRVFSRSYDVNEIRETLSVFAKECRNEVKQTAILLSMLVMLGEDLTEQYLENL